MWPCSCELKATSHFKIYSAVVNNIYNGRYGDEKGSYLCSESVWVQGLAVNIGICQTGPDKKKKLFLLVFLQEIDPQ